MQMLQVTNNIKVSLQEHTNLKKRANDVGN
jgi:hypothetical protein